MFFLHLQSWVGLVRNSCFRANFCFNSKPSFSFDCIGQRINFLLLLHIVATTKRIGLESKQTACFDLPFSPAFNVTTPHTFSSLTTALQLVSSLFWLTIFTCLQCNHTPHFLFTYNRLIAGLKSEKLWVKTRSKHPYNPTINPPLFTRYRISTPKSEKNYQQQLFFPIPKIVV